MTLPAISAASIITDSLQKIGVYAPNEIISNYDANLGLTQLNDMIDEWLGDSIYLLQVIPAVVNLARATQDYTVGPNGMVNVARPIRVVVGRGVATVVIGGVSSLADSVSAVEWDSLYSQANNVSTPLLAAPAAFYYEPQNPFGLLSVSPMPNAAGTLTLPALYGMPNFATLTSAFAMMPGQEKGLKTNLALMLNPYFGGSVVSPELLAEAQQSKTTLSLTNRLSRAMSKRNREPPARGATPRQG